MKISRWTGLVLVTLACGGSPTAVDPVGAWGGEGLALDVDQDGAVLEFDCAVGTIDVPFEFDGAERFELTGTFTLGQGGPAREGEEPTPQSAVYTGVVRGEVMTLEGRFGPDDIEIGPYLLRKGQTPLLRKCL